MKLVTRYNPWLVGLHWVLAVMIIGVLPFGFFILAPMPNADPWKIYLLMFHMAGGLLIFGLMTVRFVVRMTTPRPPQQTIGNVTADVIAPVTHYGFYVLVLLMAATGLSTAIVAGLSKNLFQKSSDALPPDFDVFPTFQAHGLLALVLTVVILLHVAAALYHHYVRHDGLLKRMWFGPRNRL
jgi:cytochrome b561